MTATDVIVDAHLQLLSTVVCSVQKIESLTQVIFKRFGRTFKKWSTTGYDDIEIESLKSGDLKISSPLDA